ncbi:MAG: OmpH family outer membrane protein, partial [Rhodospirillaceae bacterium]
MSMIFRFLACLVAATFLLGTGAVRAQTPEAPKFAIIDVELVLQEAKASKGVLPEIEKLRRDFQNQVRNEEKTLRDAEQELAQQRAILSPEAFADRRRTFGEKASDAQAAVQQRRRQLEEAFNATRNNILRNLAAVAQEVAQER